MRSQRIPEIGLILNVAFLMLASLLALSSASGGNFLFKQGIYILIASAITFLIYKIFDINFYQQFHKLIYAFNIVLLIALKFFGSTILGSQRWIKLGPLSIQPSEIAKVCLIIFLAAWLSKNPIRNWVDIFKTLFMVSIPAALVLVQPDLGTTLVYIAICFGMLFWAGANVLEIIILISPIATAIFSSVGKVLYAYDYGHLHFTITLPVVIFLLSFFLLAFIYYRAWASPWISTLMFAVLGFNGLIIVFKTILWSFLKEYQQKRLTIFLDPYADPLGAGYHIIQSLYAIGSGGLTGQGLKNGDLTQGLFVPEQHTDFIFSCIGEEFGLIGALLVVVLYFALLVRLVSIASKTQDKFTSLIAIGTFSMLFFHIFVNIGMNLSVMPITGVPLPFMSYGGSSMLVNLFLISIVIKGYTSSKRRNVY